MKRLILHEKPADINEFLAAHLSHMNYTFNTSTNISDTKLEIFIPDTMDDNIIENTSTIDTDTDTSDTLWLTGNEVK